ncbi:pyridine nucleotide NAD(P) transhydrogenase alpha plus beta subunit [Cryptosporidium bovis]|uniref:pyridine nucleotide NAD(P) transhydrogenase alpha plus beta subunit n=1 Tax=Cryptosporidium bovis TaxID=310047 RepID=UPI00351A599A|nr:pyridine nucleotide NAD(P) transhydrogenase alpha plus beta subunit [Cryptosporidium bovis]
MRFKLKLRRLCGSILIFSCLLLEIGQHFINCKEVSIRLNTSNNLRGSSLSSVGVNSEGVLVPSQVINQDYIDKYSKNIEDFLNNVNFYLTLSVSLEVFSSVCFVLCLRGLSDQETAKRGNIMGVIGIISAIAATFLAPTFSMNWLMFIVPFGLALLIGIPISHFVSMVNIPQLVALFHSFVGLAAMLITFANLWSPFQTIESDKSRIHYLEMFVGESIAAITFTGSLVAAGKLHEIIPTGALRIPGRHFLNLFMVAGLLALGFVFIFIKDYFQRTYIMYGNSLLSMLLGVHLVASIGGADMPVAISMLNSYSGWATSFTGFLIQSKVLIICGALIGSSGAILSHVMCLGMNRSLANVMFGGWESRNSASEENILNRDLSKVNETNSNKAARDLLSSSKVLIVPGYGMAVSRSQTDVASIVNALRLRNIHVEFAIHPVAGRMPGHMNVLLAEANVPYSIVKEMDEVNHIMESFDTVLVIGANDTVNPLALEIGSKISGMPVIEVWRASKVIISKRSMGQGYAAIENPLFFMNNVEMLFGNAKESMTGILQNILNISPEQKRDNLDVDSETLDRENSELDYNLSEKSQHEEEFPEPTMSIGILKELENEKLVSVSPNYVKKLRKLGFRVLVETGAGEKSRFSDNLYKNAGCIIMATSHDVISRSDVLVKVQKPTEEEISQMRPGQTLISYIWPGQNKILLEELANKGVVSIALDEVPRTTRAQKLDIRSSMSNLAGYRAVIEAFAQLPKLSKPSITAAGKVDAAKVFVIGAGVAGLQAIATAKNLGAEVFSSDTRKTTREEVESLGARFINIEFEEEGESGTGYSREMSNEYLNAQAKTYSKIIKNCDVVISTALIPGKSSPKLITAEMARSMKPGSVIVDMAAEMADVNSGWGGNCEITKRDQIYVDNESGVTIIGLTNLPSTMPSQASELFSMNVVHLLEELGGAENFSVNMEDDLIKEMVVTINEKISYIPPNERPSFVTNKASSSGIIDVNTENNNLSLTRQQENEDSSASNIFGNIMYSNISFSFIVIISIAIAVGLGYMLDHETLGDILLFSLSVIVGYYCVWNVTPSLHTPLMSVTNALSGIILLGAMLECGPVVIFKDFHVFSLMLFLAMLFSSINIIGGFYVTTRMLFMFNDYSGNAVGNIKANTKHTRII